MAGEKKKKNSDRVDSGEIIEKPFPSTILRRRRRRRRTERINMVLLRENKCYTLAKIELDVLIEMFLLDDYFNEVST